MNEQEFKNQILLYSMEYKPPMLEQFFDYWSEPNKKGKMRWELQKTWDLSRRLRRWYNNNLNWNNNGKQNQRTEVQAELNSRLEKWQQVRN